MIQRGFKLYFDSFRGLRTEVWWLALVTLINRAGSMVIPFMSLYLTDGLKFTLDDVAIILSLFGFGSIAGAWLGGKLIDKWSAYTVMYSSLLVTGLGLILLQFLDSFMGFCFGIFFLMVAADAFRPAVFVALGAYSKPENRTRSVTLIRLAINLGFAVGPAIGGLMISGIGYHLLFWADGLTCIGAAILMLVVLDKKRVQKDTDQAAAGMRKSPMQDKVYLLFLLIIFLIGFAFLQLFTTLPLYYRDVHLLSEANIGALMALSGLIVFLIEMPVVKYLDQPKKFSIYRLLIISVLLIGLSFAVLNFTAWSGILIVGMVLITVGEVINFPFLNRFAMDRAALGKSGAYMAMFAMAFSTAHIFGNFAGMKLVKQFGFEITWYIMAGIAVLAALLVVRLKSAVRDEEAAKELAVQA
jgi:predicted MFS family arabinose efflux permease